MVSEREWVEWLAEKLGAESPKAGAAIDRD